MGEIITPPSWLTKDFFHFVLNGNHGKSDFEIISFKISPALATCENYASEVYKAKIKYKENGENLTVKNKVFFIKTPVENGPLLEVIRDDNWVEKEVRMYSEYFPLVERLVGRIDVITRCFYTEEKSTLVMEDLSVKGYVMRDKAVQLDFEHSSAVLKSLATFHAASVVANKHNPTLAETLGKSFFVIETTPKFRDLIQQKFKNFPKAVQTWKNFERFSRICGKYVETGYDLLKNVFSPGKNLNVMNHGDIWVNNVMFKYDGDGMIQKLKLIDFQLSMYGSIGIDLHYFTWTSIQPSVRAHRLTELYGLYLEELNSCLEKFGCEERMNQEQFEEEMDSTIFFVYFSITFAYYVIMCGKYNKNDIFDEDGKLLTTYDDKSYVANAKQGLLFLEGKGFF